MLLAVVMSAVSLYYYLRVLKQVYVTDAAPDASPIQTPLVTRLVLWALAGLVVLLGCAPSLLLNRIGS